MKHFLIASLFFFLGELFAQTKNPGNTVSELFPVITNQGGFDTGVEFSDLLREGFVIGVEKNAKGKTLLISCVDTCQQARCWAVPISEKSLKPRGGWKTQQWYVFHYHQFPIGPMLRSGEPPSETQERSLPAIIWLVENTPKSGAVFQFVSEPLGDEWKKRGYMEYRPRRATPK